jgi:hypothetical protein
VYVPYDELMAVVRALGQRLPQSAKVSFNHDGESRAWVFASRETDLPKHVSEVLAELGLEPVPQDEKPSP